MKFTIDKRLFDLFPGLSVGVLVCRIDNTKYGEDLLDAVLERLHTNFPYEKPQDHPHIKAWRQAFTKVGISASKYPSSIESLLRRALKGGPFPRVNPIVDLYNAFSLEYLVPVGGHDLVPLEEKMFLGFAEGGEPFTPMDGGAQETAEKDEIVYKDAKDVLTRRWVWRQSNKDKVTPQTKYIFMPIDIMEGVDVALCHEIMERIDSRLARDNIGSIIHKDVVTASHPSTEFNIN
jgi:DNA/RNA-binding domain of Phe-tRNA-synthetase-like protein